MSNIPQGFEDLDLFTSNAEIAFRPGYFEGGKRLGSITFYDREKPRGQGAIVTILHRLPWLDKLISVKGWRWSLFPNTGALMLSFDPTDTDRLDFLFFEGMNDAMLIEQLSSYMDSEDKRLAIDDAIQKLIPYDGSFEKQVLNKLLACMDQAKAEG